jgi:hypothetical protein
MISVEQWVSFLINFLQILYKTFILNFYVRSLPIVQGGTFSFLAPTIALLTLPKWKCPESPKIPAAGKFFKNIAGFLRRIHEKTPIRTF